MHETSVVRSLLAQVAEIQQAHQGLSVQEVRLQLGTLAGVEPALIESAFEQLAPQTSVAGARLVIQSVPLEAICDACGTNFQPLKFRMRCPFCQSPRTRILRGDAVVLESVTLDAAETPGGTS